MQTHGFTLEDGQFIDAWATDLKGACGQGYPVIGILASNDQQTVNDGHAITFLGIADDVDLNPSQWLAKFNDPASPFGGTQTGKVQYLLDGGYNYKWVYSGIVTHVNCTMVSIGDIGGFWNYYQDLYGVITQCRLNYGTNPADSLALYVADNPWGPARKVLAMKPLSAPPPVEGTVVNVRHYCPNPSSKYYYWLDHGPGNFATSYDPSSLALYPNHDNPILYNAYYWLQRDTLDAPNITSVIDPGLDDGHRLTVNWTLSEDDADIDFYNIFRKPDDVNTWRWVKSVPRGTASYTDSDLVSGVTYSYRISAAHHGNGLWNDFSEPVSGTPIADLQWGYLSANTTWSGSVYLDGDVIVQNGATLTINAGTTVWVWPSEEKPNLASIDGEVELCAEGGSIVVSGTAQNPVKFQAWNNGGPATTANNKWAGIWIGDSAPSSATIDHAEIRNAYRGLQSRSPVTLKNSTIENCQYVGITIAGDSTNVDSIFVDNTTIRRISGGIGVNALGKKAAIRLNNCVIDSCDIGIETYTKAKLYTYQTTVKHSGAQGVKVHGRAYAWLDHTTVESATFAALKITDGANVDVTTATFRTSDHGIDIGAHGGAACGLNMQFGSLAGNEVGLQATSGGIVNATSCTVTSNSYEGFYCFNGSDVYITGSVITGNESGVTADASGPSLINNTLSSNTVGVYCDTNSLPTLRKNKVESNDVGIELVNGGMADLSPCGGTCSSGCADANSIRLNTSYHIFNDSESTLDARCNYWGGSSPAIGKMYGPITFIPYLHSNPLPVAPMPAQELPKTYSLAPNYPNPFNPITTIAFDVPPPGGLVHLRVYNVNGQLVKTLMGGVTTPGHYEMSWDGRDDRNMEIATGIYFLDMVAPNFHKTRKLVLIK